MKVKFILPALTEAHGQYWRSIKYSLFPPLGLATLAGYLGPDDEAEIVDEHVEAVWPDDNPDLVAIETYITSAYRAYKIADAYRARGIFVVLGGLHATACPEEALRHADTVVVGPAEEAWPRFLADFRKRKAARLYRSSSRTLACAPAVRRDLIRRGNYLVPNSMTVSRGCLHRCDFCYTNSFFRGGKHFYTCDLDRAIEEIRSLPGRHLFFLDDNIFGDTRFAASLFRSMRGMGRIWQGAATVRSILNADLLNAATESGLKSLFIGFESLSEDGLRRHGKGHNRISDYERAIRMLQDRGVMINASFVFGMEEDDATVFDATTEWAVSQGIETATFHILTPYPGTDLFAKYERAGRIRHVNWDFYDTRHAVFEHARMSAETLEAGYWRAYARFYKWGSIFNAASHKQSAIERLRHVFYVGAWKKMDPLWNALIKARKLRSAIPTLEFVLKGRKRTDSAASPLNTKLSCPVGRQS